MDANEPARRGRVDGSARPQGRDQGHGPRPLGLAGELAALKADARHWLTNPEYAVLHLRLEHAHAAVEAALVEARRKVRLDEEQQRGG
jgi:hypothetical protein